jgi:hypothetical protein
MITSFHPRHNKRRALIQSHFCCHVNYYCTHMSLRSLRRIATTYDHRLRAYVVRIPLIEIQLSEDLKGLCRNYFMSYVYCKV